MMTLRCFSRALALAQSLSLWAGEASVFKTEALGVLTRPVAVFDHDAHNEKAGIDNCAVCHHVYEKGKLVPGESSEDKACSDCHTRNSQGHQPGLRMAYHNLCGGCHKEKAKGPVACGQCHKR